MTKYLKMFDVAYIFLRFEILTFPAGLSNDVRSIHI